MNKKYLAKVISKLSLEFKLNNSLIITNFYKIFLFVEINNSEVFVWENSEHFSCPTAIETKLVG